MSIFLKKLLPITKKTFGKNITINDFSKKNKELEFYDEKVVKNNLMIKFVFSM